MGVSGTSLLTSLLINGGVCLVAVAIFNVLRNSTVGKRFYAPKRCVLTPTASIPCLCSRSGGHACMQEYL
jgi:hypothetical protein